MDKFVFYSRSADAKPGKGVHETANLELSKIDYLELSKIKNWRRRLSNFDTSVVFEWRGRKWRSVEHAFQSAKIALENEEIANYFSLDSNHEIGKSEGNIAQKNRKIIKLSEPNIKKWNSMSLKTMIEITNAKYRSTESSELLHILKLTKNAELWHLSMQRGKPSSLIRFKHLEDIRDSLFTLRT